MKLLAGDLGGTKTLLGLYETDEAGLRLLHEARFESAAFPGLPAMIAAFLSQVPGTPAASIAALAIGVAGPVHAEGDDDQRARITNLTYSVDSASLRALGFPRVRLVNDFYTVAAAAAGYRLGQLPAADLLTLQEGQPVPGGALAVLGAGTGLGEALVSLSSGRPVILPGEGGHSDFAPGDDVEDGILVALRKKYGHVSWERLVCGAGLLAIFEHLHAPAEPVPADLQAALRDDHSSAPALISKHAMAGHPGCARALRRFVGLYGAEAGNLALKGLAQGGVYLAGGIAPKILPVLREGEFLRRFQDKGRFGALLASMPVHVITNAKVGLLGAALCAADSAQRSAAPSLDLARA